MISNFDYGVFRSDFASSTFHLWLSFTAEAPKSKMAEKEDDIEAHKAAIRERVWEELRKVALPDSRFHYDFSSFIPDFKDSRDAIQRVLELDVYKNADSIFITPDNCLRPLREAALWDRKSVFVTSYGIRRGVYALCPDDLCQEEFKYASTLEGMEDVGSSHSLKRLCDYPYDNPVKIDLMITGTGAVSTSGVRFGKGHGFFDIEWGILYSIGCVDLDTPVVTVAHNCQVIEDVELKPDIFDTVSDYVATPTTMIKVENVVKPSVGIVWDRLMDGMLEVIQPLRELQEMQLTEGVESTTDLRPSPDEYD